MSHPRIYLSPPHMGGNELEYVKEAFASNWLAPVGPNINAFEAAFCEFTGAKHAVALSSGTAALHLALVVAGVGPGDEVLCSDFTFAATANSICYTGATPVFIDSDETSWNMDPALAVGEIRRLVAEGKPPAAVMPVHILGQSVDLDPILEVCAEHDIPVIEDAAESLGGHYRGKHTGTLGRAGAFSFNGNKIITTSGGGMLVSDDKALIDRVRFLSTQAKEDTPDTHYLHETIGYNYRLSNVLAGMGRGQLEVLGERVERRRQLMAQYKAGLGDLPGVTFMPEAEFGRVNAWLTALLIDPAEFGADRKAVQAALQAENIESRPVWRPMHTQPVFAKNRYVGGGVGQKLFEQGLCLPSGSSLSDEDQQRVIACFRGVRG